MIYIYIYIFLRGTKTLWEPPEGQITFHVTKLTLNVIWMITLLKMKSLYWHLWFCEEQLTLIEHFHCIKGSYVISFLPWGKKITVHPFYSQLWLFKITILRPKSELQIINSELWDINFFGKILEKKICEKSQNCKMQTLNPEVRDINWQLWEEKSD